VVHERVNQGAASQSCLTERLLEGCRPVELFNAFLHP
jgi:hypothetical protein